MGLLLGLGAAAAWGVVDCLVSLAGRRLSPQGVAFGFHLVAIVPLGVLVLASGGFARVGAGELLGFAGLGLVGWLSYLTFYTALGIGPISLVSPIVSGYAAFTVLLALVDGGEGLSLGETIAVLVTLAGVGLTSSAGSSAAIAAVDRRALRGIGLGLVAMVLFGGFVYGVSLPRAGISWLTALFLARCATGVCFAGQTGREGLGRPALGPGLVTLIVLIGLLDTGGYVLFDLGVRHGATSVVATASAPYSLVPVLVGVAFLHERPRRLGWAGLVLVLAGLVLLGLLGG